MGTAGGVKTTTIAVLILSIAAYLQGKKDVEVYGRRIRESYLRSAMVVAGTSVLILFTMTVLLSAVMPGVDLADVLYEITSAGATVGLSRGLTPQLNVAGKWIVILTMYLGRIGPVSYTHLDTNHHVNNCQYIRMAADHLPEDFKVGQLRVEYKRQAVLDNVIIPEVYMTENKEAVVLNAEDKEPYAVVAVSYTHLDVYKRQVFLQQAYDNAAPATDK